MTQKTYHHGNLRNALIEAGINLINDKGIHQFSLRRVAMICEVSHTAPYAHFKDIDSLLQAMSEHVAIQFTETLNAVIEGREIGGSAITELGKAYVTFFIEHPNYFQFLFNQSGVKIDLDSEQSNDYPPFTLFRDAAYKIFQNLNLLPKVQKQLLIALWAQVHGIAALATNGNIRYSGDWTALMDINIFLEGKQICD